MSENEFDGGLNGGFGVADTMAEAMPGAMPDTMDNRSTDMFEQPGGVGRRTGGRRSSRIGKAQDAIVGAADRISAGVEDASAKANVIVGKLGDRVSDTYEKAALTAQQMDASIEPFVQRRPYTALGIAAGLGVVVGLLLGGRGPKIVYVRPPR